MKLTIRMASTSAATGLAALDRRADNYVKPRRKP